MNKVNAGDRFERLVTINRDDEKIEKYGYIYWKCICDCGNFVSIREAHLIAGTTKSCKCLQKELLSKRSSNQAKYTARERAALGSYGVRYSDGDLLFADFLILTQQNCHYCGAEPSNKMKGRIFKKEISEQEEKERYFIYNGLDRVNPLLPHNKDNLVPCCYNCNRAKSNYTYSEFKEWIARIKKHLFIDGNIEKINEIK